MTQINLERFALDELIRFPFFSLLIEGHDEQLRRTKDADLILILKKKQLHQENTE